MTKNPSDKYTAPQSLAELLQRYAAGERNFPDMNLDDTDFSNVVLNGACFGPLSWFSSANFNGAKLQGVSFHNCNVKCASFSNADLRGAFFEGAAVEATDWEGALLDGASFTGVTFYGHTLAADEAFPPQAKPMVAVP
jgi:uncharacterized protein YjbI with pentapeptide repeats